ncbi:Retrotransposon gag protein [Gossypium australe]|uniref:Retrotransposon gag protein n=1 Tax=Gossypium australe TaxID=47621 RepID=A0A5B6UV57_9ROSI|nr:Retrotransposon gag protein [Gossypium australe]
MGCLLKIIFAPPLISRIFPIFVVRSSTSMIEFLIARFCIHMERIGQTFSNEVFSINLMMSPCMRHENNLRKYYENAFIMSFYNGLNAYTRMMVDTSANGSLLSKSCNEAYEILERISSNNYQWLTNHTTIRRKVAGVHEVDALTSLAA